MKPWKISKLRWTAYAFLPSEVSPPEILIGQHQEIFYALKRVMPIQRRMRCAVTCSK